MISLVAVHVTRTIKLLLFFFKTLKSFKEMFFQSLIAFPIAEDVIVSFFFVVKDVLNRRIIIKTLIMIRKVIRTETNLQLLLPPGIRGLKAFAIKRWRYSAFCRSFTRSWLLAVVIACWKRSWNRFYDNASC